MQSMTASRSRSTGAQRAPGGPLIVFNFLPAQVRAAEFVGSVSPFESSEQLWALKDRLADTNVVVRRRGEIVCVPFVPDAPPIGTAQTFDTGKDLDLVARLLQQALVRVLTAKHGFLLRRDAPPRFVSRRPGRDLLESAARGEQLPGLHVYPEYTLDVRSKGPGGVPGVLLGIKSRYEISRPIGDLLGLGLRIEGRGVLVTREDAQNRPFQDPDARRRLAGVVEAVRGDRLVLDTASGPAEVLASEAWLEARRDVFLEVLAAAAGPRSAAIASRLEEAAFTLSGAEGRLGHTMEIAKWLVGLGPMTVAPGVEIRLHMPLGSDDGRGRVPSRRLDSPVFVFDLGSEKTHRYPDKGLDEYGPFDSEVFTPKLPRIAVVTPREIKGLVEQFMGSFRNGVPGGSGFAQGFARKYRLTDCRIDITAFDGDACDAPAYRQACLAALAGQPDLAVVITSERQEHLAGNASPYLVAKSTFMGQGIPVQEVQIETIRRDDTASVLNTMALACYAKLGGTPYVIRVPGRVMAHELVVGIGSSQVRTSRLSDPERYVGITTVFNSDGNYLLANTSKEASYEQYPQELLDSLRTCIQDVKARNAWQPADTIRLIFHVFKPLKDREARAVKELVEGLTAQYAGVEFAFVHISDEHDWTMFDRASDGVPRGGRARGRYVPERGHAVRVGRDEMLVSVTGPREMKLPLQGAPRPLLLKLHRESTFTDLDYLAGQAFRFTALSWRRFYPSSKPVTILYSDLIAGLLGQLRHVSNWNADMISTKLRHSRWFL
jgi:hypothetical protein